MANTLNFIISFSIGYILGSFPAAFIIMKSIHKTDITRNGSGNVGAMNSYEVSNSKIIGLSVLVLDALKGFLSVILAKVLFGDYFIYPMMALLAAVFSHCYNPWLKFKGGRGLATAAGGAIALSPIILILWVIFWVLGFILRKNIHFSNIIATALCIPVVITSSDILNTEKWMTNPPAEYSAVFAITVIIMMLIILSKHIEPLKEYLKLQKSKVRN
jgi:glycerol-3-phosphate acyltransferase PlsY